MALKDKLTMLGRFNLRGILIIAAIFFVFYGIYLYVTLTNKPKSAYSVLMENTNQAMLQDTRVHNWNEIKEK